MLKVKSIKYKTMLSILIVVAISILFWASVFLVFSVRNMKIDLVQETQLAAGLTSENLIVPMIFEDRPEAEKSLSHLRSIPFIEYVALFKTDSTDFCDYKKNSDIIPPEKITLTNGHYYSNGFLNYTHAIQRDGETYGYMYVYANNDNVISQIQSYAIFLSIMILVVLVISTLLALYFQGRLTKPVLRLIDHADNIRSSHNYKLRIEAKGEDEFKKLYDSFNHMLDKILENSEQQEETRIHMEVQNEELLDSLRKIEAINKELIIAKSKAEESDRLKSAFLTNMSHEIRTPMNGILGFTQLLQDPNLSGDDLKLYVDIIHRSGRRLLTTVNDIVDISKIDAGQEFLTVGEMCVHEIFTAVCSFFNPEATKKGLSLEMKLALPEKTLTLNTDTYKFEAVLTNLVKNAIKFTDSGTITVGCDIKNDMLECYVQDTGIGIPVDRQKAIFNRFEQADVYDRHVYEGSGLGLAIAKSYIEMMAGKIWVISEPNKGSTFFFSHPIIFNSNSVEKEHIITTHSVDNNTGKYRFLIAEDDGTSFDHLSIILHDISSGIVHANNGHEALDYMKSHDDVDVILMDLKMPEMNGYEAAKAILNFKPQTKIIAQTAFASFDEKDKCLNAGFSSYITKPIDVVKLKRLIRDVMSA